MPRKNKLPKNIRAHGTGFRAVVTIHGDRYRSPTLNTVSDAQTWLAQFLSARRYKGTATALELTLAQGLGLILDDLHETDARPATVAFYENHARPLFAGLGGDTVKVHRITNVQVRAYVEARRRAKVSSGTIFGKELFVLRRIIKLAKQAGYPIPVDAFAGIRTPKSRTVRFEYLTKEQVASIVEAMRAATQGKGRWLADVVALLYATGIRRAELVRLRSRDIDFAKGRIWIDGKTRDRHQTFGASLEPVLRRLIEHAQPDGRIVRSEDSVEKQFDRWRIKLELPHFSPHVLRHSYATRLADNPDVTQWQLMHLLGHSEISQSSRYVHGRGDDVRGALDDLQLDPPSRSP